MNTENVSEKPRRGRPPSVAPDLVDLVREHCPPGASRRTVLNAIAAASAADRLGLVEHPGRFPDPDHEFAYLFPDDGRRATIRAELDRIDDDRTLRAVARRICAQRLPTAKAVALIRRVRFGAASAPRERLVGAILAAI